MRVMLAAIRRRFSQRPQRDARGRLGRAFAAAVCIASAIGSCSRSPSDGCSLDLRLRDAESGQIVPGLVSITDAAGGVVPLEPLLPRGLGTDSGYAIHDWSVVVEPALVEIPAGRATVRALAGVETEMSEAVVECAPGERVAVALDLRRIYGARERGYVAGNTHLHLQRIDANQSDRYLLQVPWADGLDIVFVSYLERPSEDSGYVTNRYSFEDLHRLSTDHLHFGGGQELRHNFGAWSEGYGHVLLLNIAELIHPVSIGPGITDAGSDGLPLRVGIERGHALGGKAIWAHNNWGLEDIPSWLMGRVDAMNIFDGDDPTQPMRTYRRAFYRYLNVGLHVPFSSGTDWFMYDFSRVYVLSERPVTRDGWLADLAKGRSFITNGPLLEFTVQGHALGDAIDLAGPGSVSVEGRAVGRIDFGRLELIRNGRVAHTASSVRRGAHFEAELRLDLDITEPAWLALRTPSPFVEGEPGEPDAAAPVPLNELGRELFAHTSPIYLTLNGREVFDPAVARSLLAEVIEARRVVDERGTFADASERARVLAVYDEAIVYLERRIQKGIAAADGS